MSHKTGLCKSSRYRVLEDLQKESVELCLIYCGYEECEPGHRFGPNERQTYLLHVVMEGRGRLEMGKKVYELGPGDAFFIPKETEAWYESDSENPWSYLWIGFTGFKSYECAENAGFTLKSPVRKVECREKLYEYVDAMLEAHQLSFASEMKRNGLLMLFFSEMIEDYQQWVPNQLQQSTYPGAAYVKHAVEYISHHYDQKIKINELADYIGVNRSYLTSSFKKALGCSPQEYLVNLRMEKARSMLKSTDFSINAIANAVGYTDQLAFSKIFKQHYQLSPRAYREQEDELVIFEKKGEFAPTNN